ncbi:MAG: ABC transporter ATP-binding protein/permease [Coriobacteriia bacterium]|nr:ABC transporter ATP-binding protein/permease [Coriobacteriia bacterium]
MLQLKDITKTYKTAGFEQTALDGLSVTFRDNEFAAILGPSGSGKTTLLNIIGGLDKADSGELVIDGVSTKAYKDRDWDTYRNNRIGFVFQSYNLIAHQTVLSNVELALTLSGVSKSERQQRAKQVLSEVGLSEHINKKPNQLSGGEMQRVAIARALVNDPEILMADEPTGALDSKTSLQIMELLKRIADDRLVIMVTHNPDLAKTYATRTINLSDGRLVSDSDDFDASLAPLKPNSTARRASMSFLTSLLLSFSNLMTKKGRTLMTAFAGSIGIIGIAAILALANGVNMYIKNVEESTLSQYPLTINSTGMDFTAMMLGNTGDDTEESDSKIQITTGGEGYVREINLLSSVFESVTTNDLESLKVFLDDDTNEIWDSVNAIEYTYDVTPQIYLGDTSSQVRQVNPDTMSRLMDPSAGSMGSSSSAFSMGINMSIFNPLPRNRILIEPHYNVLAGRWPESYNECVLVVVGRNLTSDYVMYTLGLRDPAILDQMLEDFINQKEVLIPIDDRVFSYEDIMDVDLRLVLASDYYSYDETYEVYVDHREDESYLKGLVADSERLRIVGIVGSNPDSDLSPLRPGINYTPELIDYLMDQAAQNELVQEQIAHREVDVFTGKTFEDINNERVVEFDMSKLLTIDEDAIADAFTFDASALDGIDYSGLMDADSMTVTTPDFPALDFSAMFLMLEADDLPLEGLINFAFMVLGDYVEEQFPDYSQQIMADFSEYMNDPQVQAYLAQGIALAIQYDTLTNVVAGLIGDFMQYCAANNIDANGMADAFPLWLEENIDVVLFGLGSSMNNDILISLVTNILSNFMVSYGYTADEVIQDISEDFSLWVLDPSVVERMYTYFDINVDLDPMITKLTIGLSTYLQTVLTDFLTQFMLAMQWQMTAGMGLVMDQLSGALTGALGFDADLFGSAFQFNMSQEDLTSLMMSMMSRTQKSYESNLKLLGHADPRIPSGVSIYPRDFECKQAVIDILDTYNKNMEESGQDSKVIIYTDIVGALMSSVTDIIDMISMVLVAFVAISLVVSSIMIGIVTYISVLERKKEIGILRSIGASKRDVGNVFNAETLIIGFTAGVLGVALTALACIPANMIVYAAIDVQNIAQLPLPPSLVLIVISCVLSFVAGLIPSAAASRRDPVEALRSE